MENQVRVKIQWRVGEKSGEYSGDFATCPIDEDGLNDFWWTDGNGACDCNRADFFLGEEWPCGEKIEIVNITPLSKT